jgi:16S rRNA G966 N2-methylase RsmD
MNYLYFGDFLNLRRDIIPDELVDLIFIDHPFKLKLPKQNITFKAAQLKGKLKQSQIMLEV